MFQIFVCQIVRKAAVNRAQSRRCALAVCGRISRSAWTAAASAPLSSAPKNSGGQNLVMLAAWPGQKDFPPVGV